MNGFACLTVAKFIEFFFRNLSNFHVLSCAGHVSCILNRVVWMTNRAHYPGRQVYELGCQAVLVSNVSMFNQLLSRFGSGGSTEA